jgi:ketosteroid isomerase-like protein
MLLLGSLAKPNAIEKRLADWDSHHAHATNHLDKVDRLIAVGNEVHSTGKWSSDFREQSGGTNQIQGRYSWVLVREGDTWKIRRHTYSKFAPKSIARHLPTLATPS